MKHFAFLVVVILLAPFARCADEQQPFFPLGLWYEGGVGDARDNVLPKDPAEAAKIYDRDFADIEAHGINVITVPNSPPEHHKLVLDAAEKHHLKVILELGLDGGPFGHMIRGDQKLDDAAIQSELEKVYAPIQNHPALLRVQLLDEPPNESFDRYGHIAAALKKFNPHMPPFCCLTGGSDGDKFLTASKSDVVAFDMYPLAPGTKEGDEKAMRDFATYAQRFADWADKHDAASWAVVQCHDITGQLRLPTAGEMRCMTYAGLATGNRGVFWFLYQSEHVGQALMGGLVDRDFKPRPLWDEVAKLSKEIQPLTPTLAKLKPARELEKGLHSNQAAYALRDNRGNPYCFVVNLDTMHPQQVHVTLEAPAGADPAKWKVLALPDQREAAVQVEGRELVWEEEIPAGGGVLYQIK